jgi:hypothetical protein
VFCCPRLGGNTGVVCGVDVVPVTVHTADLTLVSHVSGIVGGGVTLGSGVIGITSDCLLVSSVGVVVIVSA